MSNAEPFVTAADRDVCVVHWTDVRAAGSGDEALLTNAECARAGRYRREADRTRFVTATALLRRVVSEATGERAECVEIDRRCRTCGKLHGRPLLPGHALHTSITHSGNVVGVALTAAGPVGLDVEALGRHDSARMARQVLGPGEHASGDVDFYRYWTRKEAVVKATGDGIGVGVNRVLVSHPRQLPRLIAYPGRPGLRAQLTDLDPAEAHPATVAILTSVAIGITERWHRRPVSDQHLTV
jgi:4'-phosphopantetheinyl transferase